MLTQLENMNMNMLMYIGLMAILISIAISIRVKNGFVFKLGIKFLLAIGFIYVANYINPHIGLDIGIPLNPVTAVVIAVLQIPGIALIYITKFAIYPM